MKVNSPSLDHENYVIVNELHARKLIKQSVQSVGKLIMSFYLALLVRVLVIMGIMEILLLIVVNNVILLLLNVQIVRIKQMSELLV
jgi:hypothetical protein